MLQRFYQHIGGDYETARALLASDRLILRFVQKFPDDPTFGQLCAAMEAEAWDQAFAAAHTLKGLALNLAFTTLAQAASALTELLRPQQRDLDRRQEWQRQLAQVQTCYALILRCIRDDLPIA